MFVKDAPAVARHATLGAVATSREMSHPPEPYPFPVEGGYITSFYGPRTHPVTGIKSGRNHGALDIGAQPGAEGKPILAPADGKVVARTDFVTTKGGRTIVIKHDDGWVTEYMHLLSSPLVVGDRVKKGQLIALVGNTGTSTTGPHLHWVVRDPSGAKVDPLDVLHGPLKLSRSFKTLMQAETIPGNHPGPSPAEQAKKAALGVGAFGVAALVGYGVWRAVGARR